MSPSEAANKSVRVGIPDGARLLHLHATGDRLPSGQIATGKEPRDRRGHLAAVPAADFLDLGGNVGIALDGQWALVDIDAVHPEIASIEQRLPATWTQQARRGLHRLYATPPGWRGTNYKLTASDGTFLGDVKFNGQVVGPASVVGGHIYAVLDARPPVPCPDWILDRGVRRQPDLVIEVNGERIERELVECGRRDDELVKIAGFLRRRGFAGTAIATMLAGIIDSGAVDADAEHPPLLRADAARIARSATGWELGEVDPELDLRPEGWVCAASIPLVRPPREWWLYRFVPKGELTLLFGAGGIGKSSWASWLAAQVTRKGGRVLHVGVEEPFDLFALRAVQMGAEPSQLYALPGGGRLLFPRDAKALGAALEAGHADFVYLDSIYSHFERAEGSNAAERARHTLGPLAEIAQRLGVTILGTFHENKAGEFLGSTEMENVCRSLLHATRPAGRLLRIAVRKTNGMEPDHHLEFPAVETPCADPVTGEVQMDVLEDGTCVPMLFKLPGEPLKVSKTAVCLDEINEDRATVRDDKAERAQTLRLANKSTLEIASELGVTERTVRRYLQADIGHGQTGNG